MHKRAMIAGALLAVPTLGLSACGNQNQSANQTSTSTSTSTSTETTTLPPGTERLTTQLKAPDGAPVANATIDFANGYATVTVETVGGGKLTPGFHGMHIHSVGKCEPNSVAPTGGAQGDFNSAGGHYQAPGHTGQPASGDLTSLEVRSDGAAKLVTTTDAFTAQDLLADAGTALIIHENSDNFGNIPDRYRQNGGATGPDQETLSTGDAGKRVACGVIQSASASTTSSTPSTTTTTPTTTAEAPAATSPTETTTSAPVTTSTSTGTAPATTTTTGLPSTSTQPEVPGQPVTTTSPPPGG